VKLVSFITQHQVYFQDSTWYAHNGGRFDVPILLRESLFNCEQALIEGDRCTILNGRWIGFQVLFLEHESRVYFRDSFALLAQPLAKLTKDYAVPHQKLTETVSHDEITLDNWGWFEELPRYLAHDCLGLLELIDRFGAEIFDVSYTEKAEKNTRERDVANILERLLGLEHMSFRKQRPKWLSKARRIEPTKMEDTRVHRRKLCELELDNRSMSTG